MAALPVVYLLKDASFISAAFWVSVGGLCVCVAESTACDDKIEIRASRHKVSRMACIHEKPKFIPLASSSGVAAIKSSVVSYPARVSAASVAGGKGRVCNGLLDI